jgi:transposase-like protein
VNTISDEAGDGRRRRRKHSLEFKAQVVAACRQPGISMASVAMAHGVNANLLRRWVIDAEQRASANGRSLPAMSSDAATPSPAPAFVPLQLTPSAAPADIRIELRRGGTAITVTWPASAAAQCAAWMRELLR